MKRLPASLLLVSMFADAAPCVAVDADRILARDLAPQIPVFSRVNPDTVVAFTPFPPAARTFSPRELIAIARRNGVELATAIPEICFVRAVAPLSAERIRAAMTSTLQNERTHIEILDFSREPVPSGEVRFSRTGLVAPPAGRPEAPVLWRGVVRYSSGRTFAIWATAKVFDEVPVVVAVRDIRRGTELVAADIALVQRRVFPFTPRLETLQGAIGQIALKSILSDTILAASLVGSPPEVRSGDTVQVVSSNGLARISAEAIALSAGRVGDRILLRNPQTQRSFRALVAGKGRARIESGS